MNLKRFRRAGSKLRPVCATLPLALLPVCARSGVRADDAKPGCRVKKICRGRLHRAGYGNDSRRACHCRHAPVSDAKKWRGGRSTARQRAARGQRADWPHESDPEEGTTTRTWYGVGLREGETFLPRMRRTPNWTRRLLSPKSLSGARRSDWFCGPCRVGCPPMGRPSRFWKANCATRRAAAPGATRS